MIQLSFSSESSLAYLHIMQFSFLAENRPPKLDISFLFLRKLITEN
jgi:hypothetical protein